MAKILTLVTYPDPSLKKISIDVTSFDKELKILTDNMFATMYKNNGVGLAAPQIGLSKKIVVIDLQEKDKKEPEKYILINPQIIESSGSTSCEEGCLSVPGYHEIVKRKENVTVKFQKLDGTEEVIFASGMLAICMQHEIDHLNGILFVDKISTLKKGFFKSWFRKNHKTETTE